MARPRFHSPFGTSDIDPDESVILYPTFGYLEEDGQTWRIAVRGLVFEPGRDTLRKKLMIALLGKVLKADLADLQSDIFRRRTDGFFRSTERGKRMVVRIGRHTHILNKLSKRDGHFIGSLSISETELARWREENPTTNGWLQLDVIPPKGDRRSFSGRVELIRETGLSVISDIDDTVKYTGVGKRRLMLTNTFLNEFKPIDGMPELYNQWAEQGASFHYVSSSPWQLYDCLLELFDQVGFPPGTFHLRTIRFRDPTVFRLFLNRKRSKTTVIRSLLKTFPRRKFILVGDSSERDPEIYGRIARDFPHQVHRIFIRRAENGRQPTRERIERSMRRVPHRNWLLFDDPQEIADLLPRP